MELRKLLRCKIHRATVTDANLEYEGSVTIDSLLLDAAGLGEFEAVNIWNVTNGARFETYTMRGAAGRGDICINGAAAHLARKGDVVIIAAFDYLPGSKVPAHKPTLVFVDRQNRIKECRPEVPGPRLAALGSCVV